MLSESSPADHQPVAVGDGFKKGSRLLDIGFHL
jgi:hypothetical protein